MQVTILTTDYFFHADREAVTILKLPFQACQRSIGKTASSSEERSSNVRLVVITRLECSVGTCTGLMPSHTNTSQRFTGNNYLFLSSKWFLAMKKDCFINRHSNESKNLSHFKNGTHVCHLQNELCYPHYGDTEAKREAPLTCLRPCPLPTYCHAR